MFSVIGIEIEFGVVFLLSSVTSMASSVQHTGRDSMYTDVKTEASSIQTFVDAAAWSAAPFHRPPTRQSTVSSQGRALL